MCRFPPIPISLKLVVFLIIILNAGCGGERNVENDLYLLAVQALDQDVYQGRPRVVNPVLITEGNPRLPPRVVSDFQEAGFEIMEGTGEEDPTKATLYFSPPRPLDEGGYGLRVFVSLGARPGTMNRGDSWWKMKGVCGSEGCRVTEVVETDNAPWS